MGKQIVDPIPVLSSLETSELCRAGNQPTTHLFESQIGRFVLAGGPSVGTVNVGKESTNMRDANRSRKMCSSSLMVNPLAV